MFGVTMKVSKPKYVLICSWKCVCVCVCVCARARARVHVCHSTFHRS